MENTTKEIGGNSFYLRLGKKLTELGDKFLTKGSTTIISNPNCRLIGPFGLKLDFTVDNKEKYQIILQGDYKSQYKNFGTEESPIGIEEMFIIIEREQDNWFLKT